MEEEGTAKRHLSNNILLGILAALILLIIGLIIGIVVVKNTGGNSSDQTSSQVTEQPHSANYNSAAEVCEVIKQGADNSTGEDYQAAVEEFNALSHNPDVDKNPDFEGCYVSLRRYYSDLGDEDTANYYDEIVRSMVSEEEQRETEELLEAFMAESEENRQLVEDLQRQHAENQANQNTDEETTE